ncbi:hypothetical protein Tco_0152906 [Tanacetum coccineum]
MKKSDQNLFQFLNGLDRKFKPIKREILRVDPLPTTEAAYANVRKEAAHQNILGATNNEPQGIATGLIAGETEGVGFVTKGYRRNDDKSKEPMFSEQQKYPTSSCHCIEKLEKWDTVT